MKDMPKTLAEAKKMAVRQAFSDLYGFSDPFDAVHWRKTLPEEWQDEIEAVITYVYHHEAAPPKGVK